MAQFLESSVAQAVIWCAVLAVLLVCAYYLVLKFRDGAVGDNGTSNDLLSNFRELHLDGELSAAEYRKIKTSLVSKLHGEEKPSDERRSQDAGDQPPSGVSET